MTNTFLKAIALYFLNLSFHVIAWVWSLYQKKGTKLLNIHDQKGFVKTGKKKRSSCSHEKWIIFFWEKNYRCKQVYIEFKLKPYLLAFNHANTKPRLEWSNLKWPITFTMLINKKPICFLDKGKHLLLLLKLNFLLWLAVTA